MGEQISLIEKPEDLQELAQLKLENPELSLAEYAALYHHALHRIDRLAAGRCFQKGV